MPTRRRDSDAEFVQLMLINRTVQCSHNSHVAKVNLIKLVGKTLHMKSTYMETSPKVISIASHIMFSYPYVSNI